MTCPHCNGSGTYTGLNTIEPCQCQLETVSSCPEPHVHNCGCPECQAPGQYHAKAFKSAAVIKVSDTVYIELDDEIPEHLAYPPAQPTVTQAIDDALNQHATISNHFGLVERLNRLKKRTFTDIVSEEDARTAIPPAYTAIEHNGQIHELIDGLPVLNLNVGNNTYSATERDLRTAQQQLLEGNLSNNSKWLIDAVISHTIRNLKQSCLS